MIFWKKDHNSDTLQSISHDSALISPPVRRSLPVVWSRLWESGIAGDRSRRSTSHPKRGHKSSCLHWGSVVAFCGCVKSRFFRFGIQNENALQLYGRFRMKIELWFPAGFWVHGWFNKHCCKQRRCISRRWECYLTFRMMCYQPPRKPYLESFLLQTLFIQYSQSKI